MTKRERILAIVNGKQTDRPVISFWTHFGHDDHDAELLAERMVGWQETYDLDFVKMMPSGMYCVEDWGCKVGALDPIRGNKKLLDTPIVSPEDWANLRPLDPNKGALARETRCLRMVREALGPDVPIIQTVFSPLTVAAKLGYVDKTVAMIREHPKVMDKALQVIAETYADFVQATCENGADGVFFATQLAADNILTEEEYVVFGKKYDLQVLERVKGDFSLLHCHGNKIPYRIFADYPLPAVNWDDPDVDIRELYEQVKVPLVGGIDHVDLLRNGTPVQVVEAVSRLKAVEDVPLIIAAGCVLRQDTPAVNLVALRHAVK